MNVCYEDAGVNRELKIWVPLLNLKPAISPELSVLLVGDSWYKFCVLNGYRLQIHLASVVIRPIWGNILTINITLFVDQKIRVSSAPLISLSLKLLCCLDVRIKTLPKMLFFFYCSYSRQRFKLFQKYFADNYESFKLAIPAFVSLVEVWY